MSPRRDPRPGPATYTGVLEPPMDIPDNVRRLVDELGEALVQALVNDPESRALAQRIQGEGYELALSLEASISVSPRSEEEHLLEWSEEDRAFLRTFRIRLED